MRIRKLWVALALILMTIICPTQYSFAADTQAYASDAVQQFSLNNIPSYSGKPYVDINNGKPYFTSSEITTQSFESYSQLDSLGRCGVCTALVGQDMMPTEDRGSIGSVKPSGWHTVKYDCVSGKYLYNRCHLIGYQLTGENANECNLITGTRYMNVEGMLPFENMVADYVKETNNHVMYRSTPIFDGNNLVASGVLLEAYSVEDNGQDVSFCVYVYNVQPGVSIDYATGDSWLEGSAQLAGSFNDVYTNTPHVDDILWLVESGITTGFSDGGFHPYANVARCDMAAFMYRLAGSPTYYPSQWVKDMFSDVTSSTPHVKEIWWMAETGISDGFPDGTFKPYATVARCDMAAFMHRMCGNGGSSYSSFKDVNSSTPHSRDIGWMAANGISTGFADNTFRPYANVVRCDMAAFMHRMAGLVVVPDLKPAPAPKPEPEPEPEPDRPAVIAYVVNRNSGLFHHPNCPSAKRMKPENKKIVNGTRQDLINMGYTPCRVCGNWR